MATNNYSDLIQDLRIKLEEINVRMAVITAEKAKLVKVIQSLAALNSSDAPVKKKFIGGVYDLAVGLLTEKKKALSAEDIAQHIVDEGIFPPYRKKYSILQTLYSAAKNRTNSQIVIENGMCHLKKEEN